MARLIPPAFLRIYLSMLIALFSAVLVTILMVSYYLEKEEIARFLQDTNYIYNKFTVELDGQNNSADEYFNEEILYRYGYELEWIPETEDGQLCVDCNYISTIKGVELYWEYPEDSLLASYQLPDNSGKLRVRLVQPYVPVEYYQEYNSFWPEDPEVTGVFLLMLVIVVVIGCVLYYPAVKLQKQIETLNRSQSAFGKGDLSVRAEENVPQPIKKLAINFNNMADDISETVKESQIFAQAVPHEMRTPLSRIQLATGILRKSCDAPMQVELLNNIDSYIDDLDSLTSQVVTYSKLNSSKSEEMDSQKEDILLSEFISSRVAIYSANSSKTVTLEIESESTLQCYSMHLRLLMDNLIKNALSYADSHIKITVANQPKLYIAVEDDGAGIPEEQHQLLFIPFSRLDKSRNQKTGGLGLGLAIAKTAAHKLDGTLSIGKADLGGAKFIFKQ
ncbi:hypothetical protein MACH09_36190 [Vibrio sp. MACH09]|uniref:ATP-binding protein n=1 Tax=Vibrio sp. MACH09 TaxID=3025122 RepID=UPI00278F97D7|nr:ATP-binding protein [Vibrio sp. MACH09]GLO63111.1 hypothetical protein MACH09_36190 [Vibrio sp. MACH09]